MSTTINLSITTNPDAFMRGAGAFLLQNEVEHNLILSIVQATQRHIAKGEKVVTDFMTVTDNDNGEVLMTAVQTQGRSMVISREALPAAERFAEKLFEQKRDVKGVVGPADVAASFVNRWTELTGQTVEDCMDQIMYALKNVLFPAAIDGEFVKATEKDVKTITGWVADFGHDALLKAERITSEEAQKKAENFVKTGALGVWKVGGKPVAQAAATGTDTVARVSYVYTPETERGKGYASAVVAHISQQLLSQGKKLCCLYADARNPVSNSIYRKIGYEFIGRCSHYVLG